jgi:hypothetical protein
MNQKEIAKTKMYNAIDKFLTDNVKAYETNKAFSTDRQNFSDQLTEINDIATILSVDNTGYSKQKMQAKKDMADSAAHLSGFAQVCLLKLKKNLEASQLHISSSEYSHIPDTEAKALAQSAHDVMDANITNLSPDYVTADDLTGLQNLINTFNTTQGSSTSVSQGIPEQRKNFKQAIITIDSTINDICLLARKYITSNADFYNNLLAQCVIPVVNIHHTTLSVTVKKKSDNSPITNATGSLSNSKKTGTSDAKGFMTIEQVRKGNPTLSIKAAGFTDYTSLIHIISGQDNHFDIFM